MSQRHSLTATEDGKWHSALTVDASTALALIAVDGTKHCVYCAGDEIEKMRWAGHVVCMGEGRVVYTVFGVES
jgi:hypothetical protein